MQRTVCKKRIASSIVLKILASVTQSSCSTAVSVSVSGAPLTQFSFQNSFSIYARSRCDHEQHLAFLVMIFAHACFHVFGGTGSLNIHCNNSWITQDKKCI